MGRGADRSRANAARDGGTASVSVVSAASLARGAVGLEAGGGASRSWRFEQFEPSHGHGVGASAGAGAGVASGSAATMGALKMALWCPHRACARSGVKHATTTSSRAARP